MKKGAILFLSLCLVLALSACSTSQEKTTVPPTDTTTMPPESSTSPTTVPPTLPSTEPITEPPTESTVAPTISDPIIIGNLTFSNPENYGYKVGPNLYTVIINEDAKFSVAPVESNGLGNGTLEMMVRIQQTQFEDVFPQKDDKQPIEDTIAGFNASGISFYTQDGNGSSQYVLIVSFTDNSLVYTIIFNTDVSDSEAATDNLTAFSDLLKSAEFVEGKESQS